MTAIKSLTEYPGLLLEGALPEPLPEFTSNLYINICMGFKVDPDANVDFPVQYQIMVKRLAAQGVKYDPTLVMLLMTMAKNPGECVMWAFTLHLMNKQVQEREQNPNRMADCGHFADFFPMGVLDRSEYENRWGMQKVGSVNLLDTERWL